MGEMRLQGHRHRRQKSHMYKTVSQWRKNKVSILLFHLLPVPNLPTKVPMCFFFFRSLFSLTARQFCQATNFHISKPMVSCCVWTSFHSGEVIIGPHLKLKGVTKLFKVVLLLALVSSCLSTSLSCCRGDWRLNYTNIMTHTLFCAV